MRKIYIAGFFCILTASLSACSLGDSSADQDGKYLAQLVVAVSEGEECSQLFSILDEMDEQSSMYSTAQDKLRSVGCYMRDSTRVDLQTQEYVVDGGDSSIAEKGSPWPGVPVGKQITPSSTCLSAAEKAANELDDYRADRLIEKMLDECVSVDEWMSALEAYPGVMGMERGHTPDSIDLQSACDVFPNTTVCKDAAAIGALN